MKNKIPFKSVLTKFKNIENRNKKFHSLNDEEKRKEIAYDSLMLFLGGKVEGSTGSYWSNNLSFIETPDAKTFQQKLLNELPNCEVCARGAMMLSQIRLGNSIDCNEFNKDNGNSSIVKGFSMTDFQRMEKEYEHELYRHPYYKNTTEKLANICCNVIANGNFDTKDKTDYLVKWGIKIY